MKTLTVHESESMVDLGGVTDIIKLTDEELERVTGSQFGPGFWPGFGPGFGPSFGPSFSSFTTINNINTNTNTNVVL